MLGRCVTTSASIALERISARARSRRGTTGDTTRSLMPSPGIAGLANGEVVDVAPGPLDGDQEGFELDESREFGIDGHVGRLYRSWQRCGSRRFDRGGGNCDARLPRRRLVMF